MEGERELASCGLVLGWIELALTPAMPVCHHTLLWGARGWPQLGRGYNQSGSASANAARPYLW